MRALLASEHESEPDLAMPRAVVLTVDHAEAIAAESRIRESEPRRVECVEEVSADFQIPGFAGLHFLGDSQVDVVDARCAAISDVAAHVARRLVRWMGEVRHVEVIRGAIHHIIDAHIGAGFAIDAGPLVGAVGHCLIAVGEHQWLSGLECDEGIHLPAAYGTV